ncbi:MAG TPA: LamG-like jellyroll fold domain-containing protein, partial [Methanosarcinales archaeon]|nr:LamG-like jellyroll fold domain-containing protein [Methanosarcinales archaeon]
AGVSFVFWSNTGDSTSERQPLSRVGYEVGRSYIRITGSERLYLKTDTDQVSYSYIMSHGDGNWHMYTVVCDSGTMRYYLDTTLLDISSGPTITGNLTVDTISAANTNTDFEGTLANLRIYENRALSQTDITGLHTLGRFWL